jgi:protein-disulfide isomerase
MGLAGVAAIAIVLAGVSAATAPVVRAATPVLGSASAPVTIVEYADYQCPYCATWAKTVEPQIQQAYIDTGKVKLEWHDMAWMGAESKDAANAARCAGDQGKFWAYHDLLYRSQAGQNSGAFSKDRLKAMGQQLGLQASTFDACVDSDKYGAAVQADFAQATKLGITGTPAFFINGQPIEGAQPYSAFQSAIDAALAGR